MVYQFNLPAIMLRLFVTTVGLLLATSGMASGSSVSLSLERAARPHSVRVIEGKLCQRTLYETLAAYNIPASEILALSKSFEEIFDFRFSRPKDEFGMCVDDRHTIQKFVYKTSPMDEYEAVRDENGDYRVHKREIVLDKEVVSKVFTIETSLSQAIYENDGGEALTCKIADIFAWDIDFYLYPRKGDRIAVVYERCYKNGNFIKYGHILAARYEGANKTYSAYWFDDGQIKGYYDEEGQPLKKMFLRIPVKFGKMTSHFSIRRFHPISKRYKAHTGIDYGAPMGTAIFATANGQVTYSGWKGGYGKLIIVRHPNGYETYYGHCSRILKKRGDWVDQGNIIARVGQTGLATGPHVHYEVRVNDKPINPNSVVKTPGKPLNNEMMARFKEVICERQLQVKNLLKEEPNPLMIAQDR